MAEIDRASDPTTAPDELARLACSDELEVRRAVASNPATAPDTLVSLARELPAVVARHPSLPIDELLADPEALEAIVMQAHCPTELLDRAVEQPSPQLGMALVSNPCLRGDHIERFIAAWRELTGGDELWDYSEGMDLLDELTLHPAFPAALAQQWSEHGGLRTRLARNPMLPPELLRAWADDPDQQTAQSARASLARLGRPLPAVPAPEVLPRPVAAPGVEQSRPLVADAIESRDPNRLAELGRHPDVGVRLAVAGNPATPLATAVALVDDPDPAVQRVARAREDLPLAVRLRLELSR